MPNRLVAIRSSDVMWSEEGDHTLIHNFRTGNTVTLEKEEMLAWRLVNGRRTIDSIAEIVSRRIPRGSSQAKSKTIELLQQLQKSQMLRFRSAGRQS